MAILEATATATGSAKSNGLASLVMGAVGDIVATASSDCAVAVVIPSVLAKITVARFENRNLDTVPSGYFYQYVVAPGSTNQNFNTSTKADAKIWCRLFAA